MWHSRKFVLSPLVFDLQITLRSSSFSTICYPILSIHIKKKDNQHTRHIKNRATDREANHPRWFPQVLTFWVPGWVCCWGCEQHLVGPRKSTLVPAWSEAPGSDAPCRSLLPWPRLEHSGALSAQTGAPHAPPHTRQRRGGERGGGKVQILGWQKLKVKKNPVWGDWLYQCMADYRIYI